MIFGRDRNFANNPNWFWVLFTTLIGTFPRYRSKLDSNLIPSLVSKVRVQRPPPLRNILQKSTGALAKLIWAKLMDFSPKEGLKRINCIDYRWIWFLKNGYRWVRKNLWKIISAFRRWKTIYRKARNDFDDGNFQNFQQF